jgi:hypothetical protein
MLSKHQKPFSIIFLISMFCQYNFGLCQYKFLDSDIFPDGHTLFINHYDKCYNFLIQYYFSILVFRFHDDKTMAILV